MKYLIIVIFVSFFSCKEKNDTSIEASSTDSFEFLEDKELQSKSIGELRLIRNEVFARKGHVFKDKSLNDYYASKKWYTPNANAKIVLSTTEQEYVKKIKELEKNITANQPLLSLPTVNLEKERKFYEDNKFYINTELKGFINNDDIEDIIWIIDISTDDSLGGNAKEEYRLQIFLGTEISNKYIEYLKSDSVIPCNNCDNWENGSEYSFSNVKLEKKVFHFSTMQLYRGAGTQGFSQENTFIFNFDNDNMILSKVIKDYQNYDTNKKEQNTVIQQQKIHLKDFNVYDWKYVDPGMLSG
ncbi:YARHG domain-containing protein [Aquimarina muelleri]|uniref:YARHG domain-containing protein n=1 Tax=Aquimarina muelleri TaxID=279356 RepID=UPI003F68298F